MRTTRQREHRSGSLRVALLVLAFVLAPANDALAQGPTDPVEAAGCSRQVDFRAAKWDARSHLVTHKLLPLKVGTQRVFEGTSNVAGNPHAHRVTFTVTSLTKLVDGVRTAVVLDIDESDGEITEAELAMFAQDVAGNVWNLGEYPETYEGGAFMGAPDAWFAGVGPAEPGIHMPANPDTSLPEYLQGWVPGIEFLDCAKIVDLAATVDVPAGSYKDVLVTHERSPLDDEAALQVKYYAPDVGIVKIGAINDPEGETLELVEFNTLSGARLRDINRAAHVLDQRGRQCSDVYAQTTPVEGPDDGDYGPYTCPAPPPPPFTGVTGPAPFAPPPAATGPENAGTRRYRARVDHPLFPLKRVRKLRYKGTKDGAGIAIERRVRAKRVRVGGVLATAVDVEERENGRLVQRTTDYYAQDRAGNVWHLGERVDHIAKGKVTGHRGQWVAGRKGARRGLFLPAAPKVGQTFRRTRAPGVSRERATVVAIDAALKTRAGRFTGCLKTLDTNRLRGSSRSETRRYYCPDVGLVRERSGDDVVDLVRYR